MPCPGFFILGSSAIVYVFVLSLKKLLGKCTEPVLFCDAQITNWNPKVIPTEHRVHNT